MFSLMIGLAVVGGVCGGVQAPTNTALARHTGSMQSAMISFCGGAVLMAIVCLIAGQGNVFLVADCPAWQWITGAYGSLMVIATVVTVPVLGVALSSIAITLGQLTMSMIVDSFGWVGVEPVALSPVRLAGVLGVAAGVIIMTIARNRSSKAETATSPQVKANDQLEKVNIKKEIICILFAFVAGMGGPVQAGSNAALGETVGSLEATLVNFVGGTIFCGIAALIATRGKLTGIRGIAPWKMIGGFYGMTFVFLSTITTPVIGTGLLSVSNMFGQLGMSMVVDTTGIFQSNIIKVNGMRIVGILIVAAGVIIIALA